MIVDCAVYGKGRRLTPPKRCRGSARRSERCRGFAWVGLVEPTAVSSTPSRASSSSTSLPSKTPSAPISDRSWRSTARRCSSCSRPFATSRRSNCVDVGEVMVFVGPDFLITVRHGEAGGLGDVREHLEAHPSSSRSARAPRLHAIVDRIVDAYEPVADGMLEDIEEVEAEVFSSDSGNPVERIYRLQREVLEFGVRRCPLRPALRDLTAPDAPQHRRRICPVLPRRRRPRRPRRRPDGGLRHAARRQCCRRR